MSDHGISGRQSVDHQKLTHFVEATVRCEQTALFAGHHRLKRIKSIRVFGEVAPNGDGSSRKELTINPADMSSS